VDLALSSDREFNDAIAKKRSFSYITSSYGSATNTMPLKCRPDGAYTAISVWISALWRCSWLPGAQFDDGVGCHRDLHVATRMSSRFRDHQRPLLKRLHRSSPKIAAERYLLASVWMRCQGTHVVNPSSSQRCPRVPNCLRDHK
jgi:hypothetical protein